MNSEKHIYFVRHAKSDWRDADDLHDRDRSLKPRGIRDAEQMARFLRERAVCPDLFISSDAFRAVQTAVLFMRQLGIRNLEVTADLYLSDVEAFCSTIRTLDRDVHCALLFGHNPTMNEIIDRFGDGGHVPSCGVQHYAYAGNWMEFQPELMDFEGLTIPAELPGRVN